jgi:hypothetical protein
MKKHEHVEYWLKSAANVRMRDVHKIIKKSRAKTPRRREGNVGMGDVNRGRNHLDLRIALRRDNNRGRCCFCYVIIPQYHLPELPRLNAPARLA